jgi:hypothetical protein
MSGAIPPLPQYAFMARCSVKAQGQLHHLHDCHISVLSSPTLYLVHSEPTARLTGC